MLKAHGDVDGVPAVMLGLTDQNLELLRQGHPITFNVRDLQGAAELPSMVLIVFHGADNGALVRELKTNPQLEMAKGVSVRIGPPTQGVPR